MKLIILAIIVVGAAIAGLAIKMFFIKGGQFTKKCNSSKIEGVGKTPCICDSQNNDDETKCKNYKIHHGS